MDQKIIKLWLAIAEKNTDKVEELITAGVDLNHVSLMTITPLIQAVIKGDVDMVSRLISGKANVNGSDNDEEPINPLHCSLGFTQPINIIFTQPINIEIVELLLASGANVNKLIYSGDTPMHMAHYRGSKEVIRLLLQYGAKINVKNDKGKTPLHCLLTEDISSETKLEIIKEFRQMYDVTIQDEDEKTVIDSARKHCPELLSLLSDDVVDIESLKLQSAGKDYLFAYKNLCAEYEQLKNVLRNVDFQKQDLVMKGNILDYNMPEVKEKPFDFLLLYLRKVQDLTKKSCSLLEVVQKYDDNTTSEEKLSTQITNIKILSQLVSRFTFDLNRVIEDIKLECIENDWVDKLLLLIDPSNIDYLDNSDNTLLMHATSCQRSNTNIINKLLELKADPFTKCRFSETPFSKAIDINNLELAQLYLKYKIDSLGQQGSAIIKLRELCKKSEIKDFYLDLAHDLFEPSITSILGLDEPSRDICFLHIKENYEALGEDSGVLYNPNWT